MKLDIYRLTGSIEEAEDISQEALLKYISIKDKEIVNVKAWLFKVATNLSWDFLKSARYRHEIYKGPWLPDPYVTSSYSIEYEVETDESLSMALFILMEKLSPKEKVAYILHDIFDFSHAEISNIMQISVVNSRQLSSRAKRKLRGDKQASTPTKEDHIALTHVFIGALREGNISQLIEIFSNEVLFHSDGGGQATAAQKIIYGKDAVINFLIKVITKSLLISSKGFLLKTKWFNGSLGIVMLDHDVIIASFQLDIHKEKIIAIYALRNPIKLKYLKNFY